MKKLNKLLVITVLLIFGAAGLFSQELSPILVPASEDGGGEDLKLGLSALNIDVKITGSVSETILTMTFFNPSRRVIAGDLYVPMPENALLSGYALDINGVLVDGVPVGKQKGREVFEKIVRQGIDPGLAEWTKGNTFKTRVFPIPALGSRTIRVRYVSDLAMPGGVPHYRLPMNYTEPVRNFSLRVEVVRSERPPVIEESGFSNFRFSAWRSSFVADTELKNVILNKDLAISLPPLASRPVALEKDEGGTFYFTITDTDITIPRAAGTAAADKITIYWDASGSRGDLDNSFTLLREYFGSLGGPVTVDCVVFRNEAEAVRTFTIRGGRAEELIDYLMDLPYDGGTQFGVLPAVSGGTDLALLFSDGISNFGSHEPPDFGVPLYVFSEDTVANFPYLKYLAMKNSGEFFNLKTTLTKDILPRIGKSAFTFLGTKVLSGSVSGIYPQLPQPVFGSFRISGVLESSSARVALQYGRMGKVEEERFFTLTRSEAVEGGLLRFVWAQDRVNDLLIFPDRNAALIADTGKEFGIVTPGTSLIVLESLEQYVEHTIPPPRSLPEMRQQYFKLVSADEKKEKDRQHRKIDTIIELWQKRVDWWNTEFKYDPRVMADKKEAEGGEMDDFNTGSAPPESIAEERSYAADASPQPALAMNGLGGGEDMEETEDTVAKADEKAPDTSGPVIEIKPWEPSMPYLAALEAETRNTYYREYLKQKEEYGGSPAFFLDCADFFFNRELTSLGLRILSNLAELELENPALLRILAHRLEQQDYLKLSAAVFDEVLQLRPEEPQSYRDLALVLDRLGEYRRGVELLYRVILGEWERFDQIELVALMELNNMIRKAGTAGSGGYGVDRRLIKMLDSDVRIVLTWDADLTDMDLWVIEPTGEQCYYGYNLTQIGGHLSRDFTNGYGPEEYMLKKALEGTYDIKVDYFSNSAPALTGSVTLQVVVFTDYGRAEEKRQAITVRLRESEDVIDIGSIEF